MLASDTAALFPSLRIPREGTRGEGNKATALEATCKFMSISSLSGSGVHFGSNWLE